MEPDRPVPPALELGIGMARYRSRAEGIGGRVKSRPEDFLVQELSDIPADPAGEHVVFTLRKRRWDTLGAVLRIARELGLDQRELGFAGNKDKTAVTEQKVSARGASPEALAALSIPGIEVLDCYRSRRKVRTGMLRGNRFTLVVRSVREPERASERIGAVRAELGGLVPNYLGVQRFGSSRPNNHLIGRALVRRDEEGALAELLWAEHPGEPEEAREARRELAGHRDWDRALERFPRSLAYEREALRALSRGRGPGAAFRALPRPLVRLFVHAYQGFLFNRILSRRLELGLPIDVPVEGDVVLIGWKTIPVDASNLGRLSEICRAGRASVSCAVPGPRTVFAQGVPGELERAVVEEEGTDLSLFSTCIARAEGTRRAAAVRYGGFAAEVGPVDTPGAEGAATLRFELPKGAYATCVVREFTKGEVW